MQTKNKIILEIDQHLSIKCWSAALLVSLIHEIKYQFNVNSPIPVELLCEQIPIFNSILDSPEWPVKTLLYANQRLNQSKEGFNVQGSGGNISLLLIEDENDKNECTKSTYIMSLCPSISFKKAIPIEFVASLIPAFIKSNMNPDEKEDICAKFSSYASNEWNRSTKKINNDNKSKAPAKLSQWRPSVKSISFLESKGFNKDEIELAFREFKLFYLESGFSCYDFDEKFKRFICENQPSVLIWKPSKEIVDFLVNERGLSNDEVYEKTAHFKQRIKNEGNKLSEVAINAMFLKYVKELA